MKRIVTLTMNPAIDKSSSIDNVMAERKLYCKTPRFEPGGGGVNVARAIKKLGGESTLLYTAGGYTGQRLKELLDQCGLTHLPIPVTGTTRESLVILEEATLLQYRFGMPGPRVKKLEWLRCLDILSSLDPAPGFLVASGSLPPGIPLDFYARVARIGENMGSKLIVDASGEALKQALKEGVFLIKPNIREFRDLVGKGQLDETQILTEALQMIESGRCQVLVISLGSAGALLVSEEGSQYLRPPTVPVVSKVGAGDSMVAGIVLSLARGASIQEAARFGVAAGAAAVMTPGSELCRKEDVERIFAGMN